MDEKEKEVKEIWENNADHWHEASKRGYDILRDHLNTPAFLDMLPDISKLSGLDIAFGDGYNSNLIAKRCKFLTAIDISEKFLIHAQRTHNAINIDYKIMNAAKLKFDNEYFDFVVSTMAFMDIPNIKKVLNEAYRVLKPGGFLQFSIKHPCFNKHKGKWIQDENNKVIGFMVKDYFLETNGEIHEWKHIYAPKKMQTFKVPRFSKPLHRWINLVVENGFIIEELTEPCLDENSALITTYPELMNSRIVANSLIIRAKKPNITEYPREVVEKMPGNVWWKNKDLVYLGCNDRVLKVLGLTRAEFIGKTDDTLWNKEIAAHLKQADIRVLKTGKAIHLEETIVDKNGKRAIMLTNKSPLYDAHNKIIGIVGTSTDISARKLMEKKLHEVNEELTAAGQAKSQFITNMEHDIRTPAAGIAALTTMLTDSETDPVKKEKLGLLANAAQQLLSVLSEILEFHHIDYGQTPILEKRFSLQKIIQNVVNLETPAAKMKDIILESKIAANIPEFLIGDDFRIYRILLNLIGNSVKFTKKGKISINVSIAENNKKEMTIKILISDTGIGIPKDKQNEIFEKFSRVNPSNEGRYTGSGLGLRVVKQFITEIGAEIDLKSELGKGTTFTCLIPFTKCLANKSLNEVTHKNPPINNILLLPETKVLLVEDDQIAKLVGEDLLKEKFNCLLDIASTGNAAMRISKNKNYDLIFMDLGLPDMDGKKLASYFRNNGCTAPIIALTAHGLSKKDDCISAGMSDFLIKPISTEKVINIFCKWLPDKVKISNKNNNNTNNEPNTTSVIDYKLAMRISKDKKLVKILLKKLQNKLPIIRKDLENAHLAKDIEKIHSLAHYLKGMCCYCGATKLQKSAATLEVTKKSSKKIPELYEKLSNDIQLTEDTIRKTLKEL